MAPKVTDTTRISTGHFCCSLTIRTFNEATRTIDIEDGTTIIGRSDQCKIQIHDAEISRQHCIITKQGSEVSITDVGSSNGTYVNQQRIEQSVNLQPNDRIRIGQSLLFFNMTT